MLKSADVAVCCCLLLLFVVVAVCCVCIEKVLLRCGIAVVC